MLSLSGGTTTIFPGRQSGETMIVVYHENRKVVVSDDNCIGVALDDNTFIVKTKS